MISKATRTTCFCSSRKGSDFEIDPCIEEYIADLLLGSSQSSPRQVVSTALQKFPNHDAADICFALVSVAAALETPIVISSDEKSPNILELHKAIGALFADIYAYEKTFGRRPTCKNIMEFWRLLGDKYFTAPIRTRNA